MKEITSMEIPKFYEGIQRIEKHYAEDYHGSRIRRHILHLDCDVDFWMDERQYYAYFVPNNPVAVPTCPHCGQPIRVIGYIPSSDTPVSVPVSARLKLFEMKDGAMIRIHYGYVVLGDTQSEYPHEFYYRDEEYRINVRTCLSTLMIRRGKNKTVFSITNPWSDDLYKQSFLKHFCTESLAKDFRKQLAAFLAETRKVVYRKFRAVRGYDIKGLYVSKCDSAGYLYYPLQNIAFRVNCPDSPNLNVLFSTSPDEMNRKARADLIGLDEEGQAKLDLFFSIESSNKVDRIGDLMDCFELEDTPYNRRLLTQSMFLVGRLKRIQDFTTNPDYRHTLFERVRGGNQIFDKMECLEQLGVSEAKVMQMVKSSYKKNGDTQPFIQLVNMAQTIIQNKIAVTLRGVRGNAAKMLKVLADANFRFTNPNVELPISAEAKQRLVTQMNGVHFFLPDTTWQLRDAAKQFHNCVYGYRGRILKQECTIVFMSDEEGFLTACLEIHDGKLVQAKLRFNKPVYEDATVNKAVCDWCSQAGLTISTEDICVGVKRADELVIA